MMSSVSIRSLNPHLICALCSGYFIDPVTITECLHSFCKSCIIKYLDLNKKCPICDLHIHKTRPLLNIRSDKTLQEIVYKLVPGLHQEEMRRRKKFLEQNPIRDNQYQTYKEEKDKHFFSSLDKMSLSIEYFDQDTSQSQPKSHRKASSNRRFLQCPGMMKIKHLKKFVRMKYGLSSELFTVDVIYKNELIPEEYTLIDVAYLYNWRKDCAMKFYYRVFKKNIVFMRKRKHRLSNKLNSLTKTLPPLAGDKESDVKSVTPASKSPILKENSSPKKGTEVIELSINVSAHDVKQVVSELNNKESRDEPLEKRPHISPSESGGAGEDTSSPRVSSSTNILHSRPITGSGNSILSTIVQNLARKKLEDSQHGATGTNHPGMPSASMTGALKNGDHGLSSAKVNPGLLGLQGDRAVKTIPIKADRHHQFSKKGMADRSLMSLSSVESKPMANISRALSKTGSTTPRMILSSNSLREQSTILSFSTNSKGSGEPPTILSRNVTDSNGKSGSSLNDVMKPTGLSKLVVSSIPSATSIANPVLQMTSSTPRVSPAVTLAGKPKTTTIQFSGGSKLTNLDTSLPSIGVGPTQSAVKELIWGHNPAGAVSIGLSKSKVSPLSKTLNQSIRQIPNPSLLTKPKPSPEGVLAKTSDVAKAPTTFD